MRSPLLPLLLGPFLAAHTWGQVPSTSGPPEEGRSDPGAWALWETLCRASVGDSPAPVTAFRLEAHARLREGKQRNDTRISYLYLAPDCLRFRISDTKETGRFGLKRDRYWLKEGDEVVILDSRDYAADRQSIDEMAALARNYVALSDPSRLTVTGLTRLAAPPAELPPSLRRLARGLEWIEVQSPDFALLTASEALHPEESYTVQFGLRPSTDAEPAAPELVLIRSVARGGRPPREPVLLHLEDFRHQDGFRIPFRISVHTLDPDRVPPLFAAAPAQVARIEKADLRPELSEADFRP